MRMMVCLPACKCVRNQIICIGAQNSLNHRVDIADRAENTTNRMQFADAEKGVQNYRD
jgi:hypothetical protein